MPRWPQDLLQAQGIIQLPPRTPEQGATNQRKRRNGAPHEGTPSPADRTRQSVAVKDEEDEAELAAKQVCSGGQCINSESYLLTNRQDRVRALLAEVDQLNAEMDSRQPGARVKREASPIRVPSSSRERIVIDLTD